jgi:hypothetical protein
LLVNQLLLELLFPDLLKLHLARHLPLDTHLLSLLALVARLLLVGVLSEEGLVLLLLALDSINCVFVLIQLLRGLLLRRICKLGQPDLSLGHVLGQDVVDVAVFRGIEIL